MLNLPIVLCKPRLFFILRIFVAFSDVSDASAVFRAPDRLVLTAASVGRHYTVLVIARDLDDNEARCRYSISVLGKNKADEALEGGGRWCHCADLRLVSTEFCLVT